MKAKKSKIDRGYKSKAKTRPRSLSLKQAGLVLFFFIFQDISAAYPYICYGLPLSQKRSCFRSGRLFCLLLFFRRLFGERHAHMASFRLRYDASVNGRADREGIMHRGSVKLPSAESAVKPVLCSIILAVNFPGNVPSSLSFFASSSVSEAEWVASRLTKVTGTPELRAI